MYFTPLNQVFAFLGSAAWVAWLMLTFMTARGQRKTKLTWKRYLQGSMGDFLKIFLFGQVVTFLQENIVNAYVSYSGNDQAWDTYIDNEELIAWCVGIFGAYLFGKFYKVGHKKLSQ